MSTTQTVLTAVAGLADQVLAYAPTTPAPGTPAPGVGDPLEGVVTPKAFTGAGIWRMIIVIAGFGIGFAGLTVVWRSRNAKMSQSMAVFGNAFVGLAMIVGAMSVIAAAVWVVPTLLS